METAQQLIAPIPLRPATRSIDDLLRAVDERMLEACGADSDLPGSLFAAVRYHIEWGGQRTRAKLTLSNALAIGCNEEQAIILAAIPELLHNASLVHDDLQDCATRRRGRKAVWAVFGAEAAICVGDHMISAAYGLIAQYPEPGLVPALVKRTQQRITEVIHGQVRDIEAGRGAQIDFSRYQEIAAAKSGPLLGLGSELVLIASNEEQHAEHIARASRQIAVAYQIADDIADQEHDLAAGEKQAAMNAVHVLQAAGSANPSALASVEALCALRKAQDSLHHLPARISAAYRPCMRRLFETLTESSGS